MNHITAAASGKAVNQLFSEIRDNFSFAASDADGWGPFGAYYGVDFHLENGSVVLYDDNTVQIKELDIKWDTLQFGVTLDIPGFKVGGWCILWLPIIGCVLEFPEINIFGDDPDVDIGLDLSGLITSEISARARPNIEYEVGPPARWQLYLEPITVDLDVFDIPDIIGDLLEDALVDAVGALIPDIPIIKDLILAILGGLVDLVRDILDLGDDIEEWLSDVLGVSLGLFDLILTAVAQHLLEDLPLYELDDPFELLGATASYGPVKLPIADLTAKVDSKELVLAAEIGAP